MSGQRLRCLPTLKITIQRIRVPFFKWVTFSAPAPKINMTLYACLTHITQSKNSYICLNKNKINCILWDVSIITSNIAISLSVFHPFLMLFVIRHLVLLMSWLNRQCVLLPCDQFCFGGAAMFRNYQTLIINNSATGWVKSKIKTQFFIN